MSGPVLGPPDPPAASHTAASLAKVGQSVPTLLVLHHGPGLQSGQSLRCQARSHLGSSTKARFPSTTSSSELCIFGLRCSIWWRGALNTFVGGPGGRGRGSGRFQVQAWHCEGLGSTIGVKVSFKRAPTRPLLQTETLIPEPLKRKCFPSIESFQRNSCP